MNLENDDYRFVEIDRFEMSERPGIWVFVALARRKLSLVGQGSFEEAPCIALSTDPVVRSPLLLSASDVISLARILLVWGLPVVEQEIDRANEREGR